MCYVFAYSNINAFFRTSIKLVLFLNLAHFLKLFRQKLQEAT